MASKLSNQLAKTKSGLAEMSVEELTAQAGRAVKPITAIETKAIGGNDHQAKMAAVPGKLPALRLQQDGESDLSTRLRRADVRRDQTAAEQQQAGRAEQFKTFEGLDAQVQSRLEKTMQDNLRNARPELALEENQAAELQPEQLDALSRIMANPADAQALTDFNVSMGHTNVQDMLSFDDIKQMFDPQDNIQASLDTMTVGDIGLTSGDFQQMGFTGGVSGGAQLGGIGEAANLLGISRQDLEQMSIPDLTALVEGKIADEQSSVDDLERMANDPSTGAAERAEARKLLRESGATGIRSVESDMDVLADELTESTEIEFMGESMELTDMLDNEFMTGVVANYLEDDSFRESIKETEPALAQFIEKHEGALALSLGGIEQGIKDFTSSQVEKLNVRNTDVGPIDDVLLDEWMPGWDEINTDQAEVPDIVKALKDNTLTPQRKTSLMEAINQTKEVSPGLTAELGKATTNELSQLGLLSPQSAGYQEFTGYLDSIARAEGISPNDPMANEKIYGKPQEELDKIITEAKGLENSPYAGTAPTLPHAVSFDNPKSLQQLLTEGIPETPQSKLKKMSDFINGSDDKYNNYDITKSAFQNDNVLTETDFVGIVDSIPLSKYKDLYLDGKLRGTADFDYETVIHDAATKALAGPADDVIRSGTGFESMEQLYNEGTTEDFDKAYDALAVMRNGYAGNDEAEQDSVLFNATTNLMMAVASRAPSVEEQAAAATAFTQVQEEKNTQQAAETEARAHHERNAEIKQQIKPLEDNLTALLSRAKAWRAGDHGPRNTPPKSLQQEISKVQGQISKLDQAMS